jgi:hypothetical protein
MQQMQEGGWRTRTQSATQTTQVVIALVLACVPSLFCHSHDWPAHLLYQWPAAKRDVGAATLGMSLLLCCDPGCATEPHTSPIPADP